MRLLFVKLKHIGDSLLLTPTLAAVKEAYPDAEIWVVVRKSCEGILAGCPAIDRLLTAAAPESSQRSRMTWMDELRMICELRSRHFDYAFELTDGDRGRFITWLSGAKHRCTSIGIRPLPWFWRGKFDLLSTSDWHDNHRAVVDFVKVSECLPLPQKEPPPLVFTRDRAVPWETPQPLKNYAVLHPGTRWVRKRWLAERWIEVARMLLEELDGVVISAGPDPEEIAQAEELVRAIGPRASSTLGGASWAQLAWLLYGARLFVGADTAAMHLAAACQCPTVAVFGATGVAHWRPWKTKNIVIAPSPEELRQDQLAIRNIPSAKVILACRELLHI